MEEHSKKLYVLTENLFLAVFGLYLIFCVINTSTFQLNLGWNVQLAFLFSLLGTGALRLVTMFFCMPEKRTPLIKMGLCAVLTAVMWRLVYLQIREALPFFLIVLTVACIGCDFRKVFKTYVIAAGLTYLTCIFCALGDSIPNRIYFTNERIRSSWGIGYPTDFASYSIFLSLFAWIAWREIPDWFFLIWGSVSLAMSYFIAESYTSLLCSIVFILLILLDIIRGRSLFQKPGDVLECFFCYAFPVFGAFVFALLWMYHNGNSFAVQMNTWSHSRLIYADNAYNLYGLKPFGSAIEMFGNGTSLVPITNYTLVDISYAQILIKYGVVTFIVIMILWVLMSIYARKSNDRRLLYGLFMIAFHSISEHHFMEINYNILLVLPFSVLFPLVETKLSELNSQSDKHRVSLWGFPDTAVLAAICIGFICLIFSPRILSNFRTLTSISGMRDEFYMPRRILFVSVFTGFLFCVLLGILLYRGVNCLLKKKKMTIFEMIGVPLCLVVILGAVIGLKALFRTKLPDWQGVIEDNYPVLEILQKSNTPIYVTDVPEFYRSSFDSVKASFYAAEDLGRLHNTAIISDSDWDSYVLPRRGFLFTEISDSYAVYTNSQEAIDALTDAGYHMTGYYSKNKTVDLGVYRELNQLENTENDEIIISGTSPLAYGPAITLWNTNYKVTFDLSHESGIYDAHWDELDPETPVCTLRISRNNGEIIVKETTLTREQFSDGNIVTAEITSTIPSSDGVEFLAFPTSDEYAFHLYGVHYQKIPTYDTHSVFDNAWHKVHDSYFDLDGTPFTLSNGYHAVDFGYDSAENINYYRYYDNENQPVLTANGYAEMRRVFNRSRRIIDESYYDTNGEPVLRTGGYARVEREYDGGSLLTAIRYYDTKNAPVNNTSGYAEDIKTYYSNRKLASDKYITADGSPAILGAVGYSSISYEYNEDGVLDLVTYYDPDGSILPAGSSNFHQYLQSLRDKDVTVFISIRDEGTNALTPILLQDLKQLGLNENLKAKTGYSYYAVIDGDSVIEELSANQRISRTGLIDGLEYTISSAGNAAGKLSSIMIGGVEYSQNVKGMNIVVYDKSEHKVIDSVTFNTSSQLMRVTR